MGRGEDAKADAKAKKKAARLAAKAAAKTETKPTDDPPAKPELAPPPKAVETPKRVQNAPAITKLINEEIAKRLAKENVPVSPVAGDAEFIRRVYLDLHGVIPPASRVALFLDDKDPQKRAKLIDELLASSAFGSHAADIWDNLLFQRITDNRRLQVAPLNSWLSKSFNENRPWNEIVTDLLTATGSQEDSGASTYLMGQLSADKITDSASRLFLGIKLECAQCHNHPFVSIKQTDYWSMAAFFMKVRIQGNTKNAKNGIEPAINENGRGKAPMLPESAKQLPPKFFRGEQPKLAADKPYRPAFASWLTSSENPYFARSMVNRVWSQMFGRGIINPVDDMHEDRVASHPELLKGLSEQFAASGFDLKNLYRAICNSEPYQRTSKSVTGNGTDVELYSHQNIKVMTPEQLYDSLAAVLGAPQQERGARPANAGNRGPVGPREQFVAFFDPGEGAKPTDYEVGIPQALRLMNAPQTARVATTVANTLTRGTKPEQAIEKLYLTALSRRPTATEKARLTSYVSKQSSDAYGDILWALINSSEFTMNR
jgi:hypothetical protein